MAGPRLVKPDGAGVTRIAAARKVVESLDVAGFDARTRIGSRLNETSTDRVGGLVPEVLRMRLDDGNTVLVEASEPREPSIDRVGRGRDAIADAGDTLQEAVLRLRPAVDAIVTGMRGLASSPDKVQVEFGIKLTAEAGVVVARAATEANFKVCVEWGGR